MIPAKRECPDTWALEYEGYLMSGYSEAMSRHTFECVDQNPDINGRKWKSLGSFNHLFSFLHVDKLL